MRRKKRQLPNGLRAALICLAIGSLFAAGCGPSASDSATANKADEGDLFLRANPNPITGHDSDGKTTITWNTLSNDVGEVYIVTSGDEKLFATGANGSKEASGIQPGSTEFRLYTQTDRKLLARLKVTMSPSSVLPTELSIALPSATP